MTVRFLSVLSALSPLTDISIDVLATESPDDRNDLITRVLPYVVMAFKVGLSLLPIHPPSHVL